MKHNLPAQPRKILVIRRDNIGDLVCTTPAFAALRKHYPNAEIGALVNSYNAEVLRGNPNVDYVFIYQKLKHVGYFSQRIKALIERFKLIGQLRRWHPDVTILAKSSYDRHGFNFARLIAAQNIIGFVPDDLNQTKDLPDIRLKTPEFTAVHEVEAINLLLGPLGISDALGKLQVFPDFGVVNELMKCLPSSPRRAALHISAREVERRWGITNFIELARHILTADPEMQILLFWSPGSENEPHHPGDDAGAAYLLQALQSERVVPMPTHRLTELIAGLTLCELFIGTDGGAMHLAVALNKKILALFENQPGKLRHWYPWLTYSQLVYSQNTKNPMVTNISLAQVKAALNLLI